jgi:hypothetical protein
MAKKAIRADMPSCSGGVAGAVEEVAAPPEEVCAWPEFDAPAAAVSQGGSGGVLPWPDVVAGAVDVVAVPEVVGAWEEFDTPVVVEPLAAEEAVVAAPEAVWAWPAAAGNWPWAEPPHESGC